MAFRSLGLLTLLLLQWRSNASVIPFNGQVNVEEVAMEDLKDLLLTSMQNTVSLNDLVTKLTQKIVDIMLTLGDTKAGMEQMEQKLSTEIEGLRNEITSIKAMRDTDIENAKEARAGVKEALAGEIQGLKNEITSIKATRDTDIENAKEALAGVSNNVWTGVEEMGQTLSTEIKGLKNEIQTEQTTTDTDIENVKEGLAGVTNNVESLGSDIQELREEVLEAKKSREVTIVSSEGATGKPQCAKVCAGTTGRTTTNWTNYSTDGIYTKVDISGCGFVSVPTITTAMEGTSSHWTLTGMSSVYSATANSFEIFVNKARSGGASAYKYNIEWVAVGYTC